MTMPNFFIVGAAKAGTSSLYQYLSQHPEIYMPRIKETNFFSMSTTGEYSKGPGDQWRMQSVVRTLDDYRALFKEAGAYTARGEASVSYLDAESAPALIKQQVSEAKIIAILRNPVDRAYASFMHLRRDCCEPIADFRQALQEEENRIRQKWSLLFHYKTRQFINEKLKRYFDTFDKAKIKIYLYEDWKKDNRKVLKDIFSFLKVDESFSPDISEHYNTGALPRNEAYHNFFAEENIIRTVFKSFMPKKLRRVMREKLMSLNFERRPLSPDIRKELTGIFREDILKTQELIQKDLSHWLIAKG